MNIAQLRQKMHTYIENADEKILRMVNALLEEYTKNEDEVIAYVGNRSLTKSQLYAELKEAEAEIERGEYITIEELKKESELWD